MDRILLKFYAIFFVLFILIINTFPSLFININNFIDLVGTKWDIFLNNQDIIVDIDNSKSNLIIMFDDGWKSQYEVAYKYMKKKNMRGSISIIPGEIDNYKYINMANVYDLYNNKWDILNHTYNHILLPTLTYDEQKKEIIKSISWFKEKFIDNNLNILIYPEGLYNYNTIKVLGELNFISARSIEDGFNNNIINNTFLIKIKDVKSEISINTVKEWIDYIISNKLTLILLFHDLTNDISSQMTYKIKDFYKIINYIEVNKEKINIITYSDWIRGM